MTSLQETMMQVFMTVQNFESITLGEDFIMQKSKFQGHLWNFRGDIGHFQRRWVPHAIRSIVITLFPSASFFHYHRKFGTHSERWGRCHVSEHLSTLVLSEILIVRADFLKFYYFIWWKNITRWPSVNKGRHRQWKRSLPSPEYDCGHEVMNIPLLLERVLSQSDPTNVPSPDRQ